MDFSTWFTYRFRTDSDSRPSVDWEPANPPEWPEWFIGAGGEVAARYLTRASRMNPADLPKWSGFIDRLIGRGYTFENLNGAQMRARVDTLYGLTHDSFAGSFLFEPLPQDLYRVIMEKVMAPIVALKSY